jgi:pimeloyl-ACP methyl ester carboxylesterase
VRRDYKRVVAALDRRPLRGLFVDARGRRHRARVVGADVLDLLIAGDLDPLLRGQLPAALHGAAGGDPALLLRLLGTASPDDVSSPQEMSDALFVATTCEETQFPWSRTASTDQRLQALTGALQAIGSAPFLPFDFKSVVQESPLSMCAQWPVAPVAPAVPTGPITGVPTLILSGQEDLRTPVEDAWRLAENIAGASVVAVSDTGHSVLGTAPTSCPLRQVVRFFSGQPTQSCLSRRTPAVAPLPPSALSRVRPVAGTHGAAGGVLGAVRDTVGDAASSYAIAELEGAGPAVRLPGLRAGSYRITPSTVALRGAEYVPGVIVDGKLRATAAGALLGTVRVRAPHGLSGTVTLEPRGALRAHLGGQTVRARVVAATASAARVRLVAPARRPLLRMR